LAKLADAKKHDLTDLDADINEEELHIAIKQMPTEKAPDQMDTSVLFTRNIGKSSKLI
jgi:hypothetical protein